MAPTAAAVGRGQCAYAGAESEFGDEGAPREGRGRSYLAARSVPSPGRSSAAPQRAISGSALAAFEYFLELGVLYYFDTEKCFAAFLIGTSSR